MLTDLDFLSKELETSPRASVFQRGLERNIAFLKFEFSNFIILIIKKNLGLYGIQIHQKDYIRIRKSKKKGRIEHGKEKYGLPPGARDLV